MFVLDAPCGDFFWMKEVTFYNELNYLGGDIVGEMINQLDNKHSDSKRKFVRLDVVNDILLPQEDLWLCRDCFIHLSNDEVMRALGNFVRSRIQYILTTTYNLRDIIATSILVILYQPSYCLTDGCPLTGSDGCDSPGLVEEP